MEIHIRLLEFSEVSALFYAPILDIDIDIDILFSDRVRVLHTDLEPLPLHKFYSRYLFVLYVSL